MHNALRGRGKALKGLSRGLIGIYKVTPLLLNDITFCFFKNVNRIYAVRSDFYAAAPSLRVSIKQQCFCLASSAHFII